jgi:pimeloyl-ACP methyl ester carboxylesterase
MKVNFDRRGSGPPLVLIHGIGHRWQAWEPVLDSLAEHHDVISLDLPGFGESPVPDEGMPAQMSGTVTRVGEFFVSLGLDRPHVAGNSLGGAIALELAAEDLVASATAFSPAGFFTEAERKQAVRTLGFMRATTFQPQAVLRRALALPMVRAQSFGRLVVHPERLTAERAFGDTMALRRGVGFRAVVKSSKDYSYVGQPTVPVTVAWGTQDRILPPRQADRARERLPEARHVALPGCGHVPMSDAPQLCAQIVLETTGAMAPDLWDTAT